MTLETLIHDIKEGTRLRIRNDEYKAIAKSLYVTQSNPEDYYAKVFFEDHYVMAISPSDDFLCFGKDIGQLPFEYPSPDSFDYEGETYQKVCSDYQIVKELVFGSPLNTEGEVKYTDYEGKNDDTKIISIGPVVRTGTRADIIAEIIDLKDISIL